MNIKKEHLRVGHILKVDCFGQDIKVLDDNTENGEHLVKDAKYFFDKIYVNTCKSFKMNGIDMNTTIEKWVEESEFANPLNTMLYFIRGYAGCGKSTLVQRMLYHIFNHENYDYSYYNYDIGGINSNSSFDEKEYRQKTERQEEDQIAVIMRYALRKQICNIISQPAGKEIFDNFIALAGDDDTLRMLMSDSFKIFTDLVCKNIKCAVYKQIDEKGDIKQLEAKIEIQLRRFGRYDMFCIDYLWRLAQYITDPTKYSRYCYVCYDNLDAIENYSVLKNFHMELISFRHKLNTYIEALKDSFDTRGIRKYLHHFMIFATYRKITAVRTNMSNYETTEDYENDIEYVKLIDVSEQYDFNAIANKRIHHFEAKFKDDRGYLQRNNRLLENLKLVPQLTKLDFVKKRYAGMWNHNFRACSNVIDLIIEMDANALRQCVKMTEEDGHGKYSYYYGASSVFLNLVCKVLNKFKIFGENHMGFVNLTMESPAAHYSISRLIMTYLNNCIDKTASITELYDKFKRVFTTEELCGSISKMLTRVQGEIWRRPIYYSRNAPRNEIAFENELVAQCNKYECLQDDVYVEFCLGECGTTLIEAVIPNFEFYATRIDQNSTPLYLINNPDVLKNTLSSVYNRIKNCCNYQKKFMEDYIEAYNITTEDYLKEKFHPRTNWGSPQLHIERIIFSHISYFNKCRMYIIKKYMRDDRRKEKLNSILLDYIEKYLELYSKNVLVMSNARKDIYNNLAIRLTNAKNAQDKERYASIAIKNDEE